jgi:hypothetical protein
VTIVHTAGEKVLVSGLLQAGEQIVCEATHRIVPGQLVEVDSPQRTSM